MTRRTREPGDDDVPEAFEPPRVERTCAWETQGRRCLLTPGVGPIGRPGYCGFHYGVRQQQFECTLLSFKAYHAWIIEAGYCSDISHYPAAYLWPVLVGVPVPVAQRIEPVPCRRKGCPIREEIADGQASASSGAA